MKRAAAAGLCCVVLFPSVTQAQGYRVRIDASAQGASYRGLQRDSIPINQALAAASGGLVSPDGHAVRCDGSGFCHFFRAGPTLRSMPLVSSASVVLWGLGVQGLAFHAAGRFVADAGRDRVWPATAPSGQLLEGYFEYQHEALVARAGRLLMTSRLEPIGFDGASLRVRAPGALEVSAYGGWGLGQAAVLPASSPLLNPLDEWRPRRRQQVAGAELAWSDARRDVRAEYRREIDPEDRYFVSERAALSVGARFAPIRLTAGTDYNMAEGRVGSAEATATYLRERESVSIGVRRYRPYFSLWTLWGAFSPVGYNAVFSSADVRIKDRLSLTVRGERYQYDDADISTALVPELRRDGWRSSLGAHATINAQWTVDGTFSMERGPGASGRFVDGSVTYAPRSALSLRAYGGTMARPLELRYYDATSRWIGMRADWQVHAEHRIWGDAAWVTDRRARPDAGASSLSQARVRAGLSMAFGSRADRSALPPARRTGT